MTDHVVDALYLSPHLDDVVLSCGGQLYEQVQAGARVLVVTVTAGEPPDDQFSIFAEFQHHQWGLPPAEVVAARRAEDAAACALLGVGCVQWETPDAIYRRHPETGAALYDSEAAIFGPLHESEQALVAALAVQMQALPPAKKVVAPLTLGNHVDHQLTRAAAEQAFGAGALSYYEDYPYAQRDPDALAAVVQPREAWRSTLVILDEEAVQARIEAIEAYQSQLSMLFNDAENMKRLVREHVREIGGERLWKEDA